MFVNRQGNCQPFRSSRNGPGKQLPAPWRSPLGTAFAYQGHLQQSGEGPL